MSSHSKFSFNSNQTVYVFSFIYPANPSNLHYGDILVRGTVTLVVNAWHWEREMCDCSLPPYTPHLLYDSFRAILAFPCISFPDCKTGIVTALFLYLITVKCLEGLKYEQK